MMGVEEFLDIRRHAKNKDSLLMDYYAEKDQIYSKTTEWSSVPETSIYSRGYYRAEKFQTELKYAGVKTFVRFHGWKECDSATHGNYMTSATLYDYLKSDASFKFMSGMTKIQFAPIDLKMLILALPIIAGIIIGMIYFMGGH